MGITDIVVLGIGIPFIVYQLLKKDSLLNKYNPFVPGNCVKRRGRVVLLIISAIVSLLTLLKLLYR